jgi:methionyl-tRNA formyltransferase
MVRALSPWPGVWTVNEEGKSIKILETHHAENLLRVHTSQIAGEKPRKSFIQF